MTDEEYLKAKEKARKEAQEAHRQLLHLKNILEETPEYKAVLEQNKIFWEAQERLNQLISDFKLVGDK